MPEKHKDIWWIYAIVLAVIAVLLIVYYYAVRKGH